MKKKIYNQRFDIRIPEDLLEASRKLARINHLTMSQLVRNLLVKEIHKNHK